jgi:copper chaperone CopZ
MVKGSMTNVEISYKYGMSPDEAVMRGIDNIREVYGIRRLSLDEQARSVNVEYDATRLNPATIASLLRRAGLDVQFNGRQ